jgi:hypothetical protein
VFSAILLSNFDDRGGEHDSLCYGATIQRIRSGFDEFATRNDASAIFAWHFESAREVVLAITESANGITPWSGRISSIAAPTASWQGLFAEVALGLTFARMAARETDAWLVVWNRDNAEEADPFAAVKAITPSDSRGVY